MLPTVPTPLRTPSWWKNSAVQVLAVIILLYLGRGVLIPLLYGGFVATILYPLCRKLENRGWRRLSAILLSLLLISLLFIGLAVVMAYQYNLFVRDLPQLIAKMEPLLRDLSTALLTNFGISIQNRHELITGAMKLSGANLGQLISTGISGLFGLVFYIIIVPLYAALLLLYRKRLMSFLYLLAGEENRSHIVNVAAKSIESYGNYIKGMFWVYLVVGILNSIGLLILGIKYAVLFGMISAIMTIIPYFGIIVSSLLPISISWLSTGTIYGPLGVVVVFSIVQYLEGNLIYPYIVGKRVNVNILVALFSVFAGGLLWGVNGMVLVLPLVAVMKIIADETERLKPLSVLLGDKD